MNKKYLINGWITSLMFISLLALNVNAHETQKLPNIIFIMTDDQSAVVPLEKDKKTHFQDGKRVQSHPFGALVCGDHGSRLPPPRRRSQQGGLWRRGLNFLGRNHLSDSFH